MLAALPEAAFGGGHVIHEVVEPTQEADAKPKHSIKFSVCGMSHDHIHGMIGAVQRGGGTLVAALVAPRVRRIVTEERMLTASLVFVAVGAAVCARFGNRAAGAALAGIVGVAAAAAKLAFDSIVQRDAPAAAQGRAFARFETRFQLAWVAAALLPVVIPIPTRVGMIMLAAACTGATIFYTVGRRS